MNLISSSNGNNPEAETARTVKNDIHILFIIH